MAATETVKEEDESGQHSQHNNTAADEPRSAPGNHFTEVQLGGEKAANGNHVDKSICDDSKISNAPAKLKNSPNTKGWVRHLVAVLALSSIVLANMNRQAFNQALVKMKKKPTETSDSLNSTAIESPQMDATTSLINRLETTEGTSQPETIPSTHKPTESSTNFAPVKPTGDDDDGDVFDWTGTQVATLQAAFSYGYTPFMIPGGRLSELYGAKWVVFVSGFGSALCCIFSPFFADTNYNLLVASRVIMGLSQTGVSPALYALLTRWLPPEESSVYLPMIKVGVVVGFMSGSLVSGFFTWRVTFYLVGLIGLLWSAMWALTVSSDPGEHKFIGKRELGYIRAELQRANEGRKTSMDAARKAAAPWFNILTNPVVVAFMLAKFTVKLSTDAQTTQIPMYLNNVFKVSDELNATLTATNFAIQGIFTGLVAWLAKEFVVRRWLGLSKTGVRRLFQGVCNFGMGLAYILITFNMSSLAIVCCAVVLLSVAAMFGAGGEAVTPVDLSADYSASIMAIANSSANLSGIILPFLVSTILADQFGSSQRWNLVWRIVGALIMAGGLVYTCRVDAKLQDFSGDSKEQKSGRLGKNKESLMPIEMKSTYKKTPFDKGESLA